MFLWLLLHLFKFHSVWHVLLELSRHEKVLAFFSHLMADVIKVVDYLFKLFVT